MSVLGEIEPKKVFEYFEEIAAIPHGSTDTKRISDHIAEFAEKRGLDCVQDEKDNLIIRKAGSAGYENAPCVMLQGHIDMVCEKEENVDFDFKAQGLKLKLEEGKITAQGTTLGGDDGIAVAYCMALLDSDDIAHPPLEVVLTSDEEIGMLGAAALDMKALKSKILINIDSEEEGVLLTGCAGGVTTKAVLPVKREEFKGERLKIKISGLIGGHSGEEINKGRANADKLLGRLLYRLTKKAEFRVEYLEGGSKDNAIPRSAQALIVVSSEGDIEAVKREAEEYGKMISKEFAVTDPDVAVAVEKDKAAQRFIPMDLSSGIKAIQTLVNLPNGIQKMSFDVEGLVETSLNLGIMETEESQTAFSFSVRSSVGSEKQELVEKIECLMEAMGGYVENSGEYPAWEYKADSKLREIFVDVYKKLYGREPRVEVIHAGLECGLFAGNIEGLDAVSFGPDVKDIHTPKETMDVSSVKRTWEYLLEVLKAIK